MVPIRLYTGWEAKSIYLSEGGFQRRYEEEIALCAGSVRLWNRNYLNELRICQNLSKQDLINKINLN